MTWLVPFFLLAGFLAGGVRQDANAHIIIPLLLAAFAIPALRAIVRTDRSRGIAWLVLLAVVGFGLAALLSTQAHVVFADLFGPRPGGIPVAFPFFFVALSAGVVVIARHYVEHPLVQAGVSAVLSGFVGLLVMLSGFSFNLWIYRGVHSTFSLAEIGSWALAGAVAALLAAGVFRKPTKVLSLAATLGLFCAVAFFTGIAISHVLWLPGILGLIFLQFGFLARHYL